MPTTEDGPDDGTDPAGRSTTVIASKPRARKRRRPSGEAAALPRQWDRVGTLWLVALSGTAVLWFSVIRFEGPRTWFTNRDLEWMEPIVDLRTAWLTSAMLDIQHVGIEWLIPVVAWPAIVAIVVSRRWRHLFVYLGSLILVAALVDGLALAIGRPRPFGIEILGEWHGWSHPSQPVAALTAACVGAAALAIPRGRWRAAAYYLTAVVVSAFGFSQIYLGVDHPTDVIFSVILGASIPLILVRLLVPERIFPVAYGQGRTAHLDLSGERSTAIQAAVGSQFGLQVKDLEPVGLEGSAGSTPVRLEIEADPDYQLFGKIYARNHLRSDRWYKLGRELRYGRLEDEASFRTVSQLVQYEDYLLHLMEEAGVPGASPFGIVEITPHREYLLLTQFLDGAVEIDQCDVDVETIDSGLAAIRAMWAHGLAHRDIKPANVMVRGNKVHLIDVAFGEVRPSPWREAVDLANMMLILALRSSPELVLERARRQFTEDEIAEAFAASRGITLPSQLRRQIRDDGRGVMEEFRQLLPKTAPIAIQRWSFRRVALTIGVLAALAAGVSLTLGSLEAVGLW
jgi:membrane-associated phospholipid phosphatase/tRNA A-37 threonylcarbamoyl transferase component Bud32